jgi:hypothetical protein
VDGSTTTKGADLTNLILKSGTIEIGGAGADTFFVSVASTDVNV